MEIIFTIVVAVVYFAPAIAAYSSKHKDRSAIFLLTLFLGWTFVGWVIAAVWSAKK